MPVNIVTIIRSIENVPILWNLGSLKNEERPMSNGEIPRGQFDH